MSLVTLETWAAQVYGDQPPSIGTLRRWAREGRIYPAPKKHGRSFRVLPTAVYLAPGDRPPNAGARPAGGLLDKVMRDHGPATRKP